MFRQSSALFCVIAICSVLTEVVECQTDTGCSGNGSRWLVIQRRQDGSVNFYRTWNDYSTGFGDLNGDFWIGNENLFQLTSGRNYKLHVSLEDFEGQKRYAEYSKFSVGPCTDNYRLTIEGYSGNAGDAMTYHNDSQFTTLDRENDVHPTQNCAQLYRGGWWYRSCHYANLNGLYLRGNHSTYADGIEWNQWRGYHYSLKKTEMKIALIG